MFPYPNCMSITKYGSIIKPSFDRTMEFNLVYIMKYCGLNEIYRSSSNVF